MTTMSAPTSFRQVDGFDVHCLYTENDFLRKENQRLRIAHLRRMSDAAFMLCAREEKLARTSWEEKWKSAHTKKSERFIRFCRACRVEIARLRGEG